MLGAETLTTPAYRRAARCGSGQLTLLNCVSPAAPVRAPLPVLPCPTGMLAEQMSHLRKSTWSAVSVHVNTAGLDISFYLWLIAIICFSSILR